MPRENVSGPCAAGLSPIASATADDDDVESPEIRPAARAPPSAWRSARLVGVAFIAAT